MNAPIVQHLSSLRDRLGRALRGLCEREPHLHTQRIFVVAIYGWLLLNTLLLLPYYESLWGPASLANRPDFDPARWHHWLVHLSLHPAFADRTWVFLAGQLFCVGLVLGRIAPRLGALGVWLCTFNVYHRTGALLDGGNNLAELLLFYFVLMNVSGRPLAVGRAPWRKLAIATSNAAFYLCRIQVVVVYLCAGVLKLNGPLWQKGMALYYILQGESYTHPAVQELVLAFPAAAMIATYATMMFQVLFVVLIWWRPARPYLIAAGVGLHLFGIGLAMGLFFFGLVMCLAYLVFLPGDVAARVRGPWLERAPLVVVVPAHARRLVALSRVLTRIDLAGRIAVKIEANADELVAVSPGSLEAHRGLAALWMVLRRFPAALPLVPLALGLWYVGFAQLAWRRWLAPAT